MKTMCVYLLVVVLLLIFAVMFTRAVVNSDMPTWLKIMILK